MTYPNTERGGGKKSGAAEFFKPTSKCLETETLFRVLLKTLIIVREIQSKIEPNFVIIRITYPNLLHIAISFVFSS